MIDELKALEVDWSMKGTIELLDNAIGTIKDGKAGQAKDELYSLIKLKITEAEEYYEKPLDSIALYGELEGIAKGLGDTKTATHAHKQIATYEANDLEFLGYQQAFFGNNIKATEYYKKALELVPDYEMALN
ncbi:MAG: hypothetical protein KAT70_04015, partial [Thermoplasmata archaeon]|nr:hypothetical protein [Thermoplasmata archaeon]